MRKLIWRCADKAKALTLLIDHGLGKTVISPLAAELADLSQTLLGMYDRNFAEDDGGAA